MTCISVVYKQTLIEKRKVSNWKDGKSSKSPRQDEEANGSILPSIRSNWEVVGKTHGLSVCGNC